MDSKKKIAIMYDFDYTLSTKYMQDFALIPKFGMTPDEYWKEKDEFTRKNRMEYTIASMCFLLKKAKEKDIFVSRKFLVETGKHVEFYPGMDKWFSVINSFGNSLGVTVEHYIISSGFKEIIEGTSIVNNFKKVFASEFFYNEEGRAIWPLIAVNYTNKTQFIFRINKGILNICDNQQLNTAMPDSEKPIPFSNMIFLGDGLTDVPCMKIMNAYGGTAIGVYSELNETVKDLLRYHRADYIVPADYTVGGELEQIIKKVINRIATI